MKLSDTAKLVPLTDAGLTVENPEEDVRGFKVLDSVGEEVGEVDDLIIDDEHTKVRFLVISSGGGFLGMGRHKFLLPVDAITRVATETVHVDRTREHVASSPAYDPAIGAPTRPLIDELYAYYGYNPYWGSGYVYPPYPYFLG